MPDLNLIDEGGFDESPTPAAPPARKKTSSGGGGGGKIFVVVVLLLVVVAVAAYFLNKRGIIKLWGKKQPPVAQVQDEPFPQEPTDQVAQDQAAQKQADTNEVALLDTPPVEEKADAVKSADAAVKKQKEEKKKEDVTEAESTAKLSDMKGEFTIQVVAYREKKKAEETSKNLEFSGYPSFVEKVPMKGGDWFTVRIGRYASRVEAKKAVKSFAAQLQANYVIDKVRSK